MNHLQIESVNVVFAELQIWAGRKNPQVPKNFARQNTQERIPCSTMIVNKPFSNLILKLDGFFFSLFLIAHA
jgi:hypothetical protein